ncbi:MAG: hypothetical protein IPK98_16775 [Chloracidobacterium sp.]|nr:hypothetical protein [Chloracidobacterium sp.]
MDNPILVGLISWFVPGLGHLMRGAWFEAIIAVIVWSMFVIALLSGGAHYPGFDFKDGTLLYLLNAFARLGNGLGAIVSFIMAERLRRRLRTCDI